MRMIEIDACLHFQRTVDRLNELLNNLESRKDAINIKPIGDGLDNGSGVNIYSQDGEVFDLVRDSLISILKERIDSALKVIDTLKRDTKYDINKVVDLFNEIK